MEERSAVPRLSFLITGALLPLILFLYAIFLLIYLKGIPFRGFFAALAALKKEKRGERSPFQAVTLALAGTLGVGNMVGVAAALKEGGAGVLFWMWLSCLAAMVVKYAEIVLSIRKKRHALEGSGATSYMPRWAGVCFCALCLLCAFSVGCALQTKAFADALSSGVKSSLRPTLALLSGVLLCLPLGAALFKKGTSIPRLTLWLVPLMSLLYVLLCTGVLLSNTGSLLPALKAILTSPFSLKSATLGGSATLFTALRLGVVRGILSNEAGCGTAPFAYSDAPEKSARAQGTLGMVEVAFDTLFLCTLTGLSLLVYPESLEAATAIDALLTAFSSVFGSAAKPLLTLSLYFFALATLLCWSFYGKQCIGFLFKHRRATPIFSLLFGAVVIFAPLIPEGVILSVADLTITSMTLINLTFLFFHRKELQSRSPSS